MNSDSISSRIRSFILQTFPVARKRAISDDAPLLGSGIIDSLATLDVVDFLEQSFAIKIADDELTPDNFMNINSLARFVEKKKARVGVLAE
jgi:acyl carrier protein